MIRQTMHSSAWVLPAARDVDPPTADHWRRQHGSVSVFYPVECRAHSDPDLAGGERPDDAIDRLATGQNQEGGNAHHVETCGDRRGLIDVYLDDLEPPGELCGELLHCRPYHPAGSTPGRPQIDKYGKRRHRGHGIERRIACLNQPREGSVALPTAGRTGCRGRYTVPPITGRATDLDESIWRDRHLAMMSRFEASGWCHRLGQRGRCRPMRVKLGTPAALTMTIDYRANSTPRGIY